MEQLIELIRDVGFPVAIALLFYVDFRKVIIKNTDSINDLRKAVSELCKSNTNKK